MTAAQVLISRPTGTRAHHIVTKAHARDEYDDRRPAFAEYALVALLALTHAHRLLDAEAQFKGGPTTNALEDASANANKSLPPTPAPRSGADEKKEIMDRLGPQGKPIDMAQQKGDHWAKDPTTGGDVLIKNPEFERV
jgi:hypothetical protein